jgi:hypothetical protein
MTAIQDFQAFRIEKKSRFEGQVFQERGIGFKSR